MAASKRRTRGGRFRWMWWVGAWAGLAALGTGAHMLTWAHVSEAAAAGNDSTALKLLNNVLVVPAAPGWMVMTWINQDLDGMALWFVAWSNLLGWAVCVVGGWVGVRVWKELRVWASHRKAAETPAGEGGEERARNAAMLSRRRLLVDGAALGVAAGGGAVYAYSTLVEPWRLRVREFSVAIKDLPAGLDGLSMVHVSDTHFGPRVPAEHVRRAVELALSVKADIVALVGDYIHRGPAYAHAGVGLLKPLIDSAPCVAVLGNHDNYFGAGPVVRAELAAAGAKVLDNRAVFVREDRTLVELAVQPHGDAGAGRLAIAGVRDYKAESEQMWPWQALMGIGEGVPRVLLSHNPDVAEHSDIWHEQEKKVRRRVDLILSGHTHGGQVKLPVVGTPIVPSQYGSRYASGLNQGPVCPVVTSNGVGVSILPMRLGVPPEVVKIVLKKG